MFEALKIIGASLGVIAFAWKVWDSFASYLHIYLEKPQLERNSVTISARIENRSLFDKKVTYAILLIGPEHEDTVTTARMIASRLGHQAQIHYTNDIESLITDKPVYEDQGRALIPLPFFYLEQIAIGDEDLSYRTYLPISKFEPDIPYSVRFFIFGRRRLHRSTQDGFIIPYRDKQSSLDDTIE